MLHLAGVNKNVLPHKQMPTARLANTELQFHFQDKS